MPRPKGWKPKPKEVREPSEIIGGGELAKVGILPNETVTNESQPVIELHPSTIIRRLRSLAIKLGFKFAPYSTETEITAKINEFADSVPEPQEVLWYFTDPHDADMVVRAVDPQGNYEAALSLDGEFSFTKFTQPNLHNRRPGVKIAGDQRLDVTDIDDLIARLVALRDGADPILNDFSVHLANNKAKEDAEVLRQNSSEETQDDRDRDLIDKYASEYGLLMLDPLNRVYRLSQAFNLPTMYSDAEGSGQTKVAIPAYELRTNLIEHLHSL